MFTPDEFVKYKNWDKKNFPHKIIITYDKKTIGHFKRKFMGKYKIIKIAGDPLLLYKNIGIIYSFGIGSPFAATLLEELIAMGGKEFINMGTAGGLVNATKFITNKELAGKQNAIQVTYDVPFTDLVKEGKGKIIVLKQIGVESGFDLNSFASTEVKNASSQQPINLAVALNQKAFLVQRKLEKIDLNFLTYITNDNVLILLSSPYASVDELIQFAQSLQ